LPVSKGVTRLLRRLEVMKDTEIEMSFGFSDELLLMLNNETLYSGVHLFKGFQTVQDTGSILTDANRIVKKLSKGYYQMSAVLKVYEAFGWGISLRVQGEGVHWLPATSQ
jgi:hypothetical protein